MVGGGDSLVPWEHKTLGPMAIPAAWMGQGESQYYLKVKFPVSLAGVGGLPELKLIYGKILVCSVS